MEWVEVRGKTVEVAVEAAMQELGIDDAERVDVEVLQQPEKGFLGLGGKDAVVRVKPKSGGRRRRRRRGRGKGDDERGSGSGGRRSGKGDRPRQSEGGKAGKSGGGSSGGSGKGQKSGRQRSGDGRGGGKGGDGRQGGSGSGNRSGREKQQKRDEEARSVDIQEQVPVVERFLAGLVESFGLEGDVRVRVEDETIVAEIAGPQTEAMVGPRGSVIEAIHELTKTVLQRQTQASARVRLDIAGYAERRRQALAIYAEQLIDQVLEEGGEVMLEPMSAGDRKVVHDAVANRQGVRSYSEGEAPQRYVVIAAGSGGDEEE